MLLQAQVYTLLYGRLYFCSGGDSSLLLMSLSINAQCSQSSETGSCLDVVMQTSIAAESWDSGGGPQLPLQLLRLHPKWGWGWLDCALEGSKFPALTYMSLVESLIHVHKKVRLLDYGAQCYEAWPLRSWRLGSMSLYRLLDLAHLSILIDWDLQPLCAAKGLSKICKLMLYFQKRSAGQQKFQKPVSFEIRQSD